MAERPLRDAGLSLFTRQAAALLQKQALIRLRSWERTLTSQLLQPLAAVFIIWVVGAAVGYSNRNSQQFTGAGAQADPPARPIADIPDCRQNTFLMHGQPCLSFIYTPAGHPLVEAVVAGVLANNRPPLPAQLAQGMVGPSEVNAYLLRNPQTALAAVHFRQVDDQRWAYTLQVNDSVAYFKGRFQDPNTYIQLPLQVAVEREFARLALQDPMLRWRVALRDFPHPSLTTTSVVGRVAPVFLLAALMANVVLMMQDVLSERELGLRGVMTSMGLLDSSYWTAIVIMEMAQATLQAALLTALAAAFRFDIVTRNAPQLLFLLLLTAGLALAALALAITTCLRKSAHAVPVALVLFIVAWVFMIVQSLGVPYNGSTSQGLVILFSLFPWSLLSKGLLDLADATTGTKAGISWANRAAYCHVTATPLDEQARLEYWKPDCVMPISQAITLLTLQAAVFLGLALYLDAVLLNLQSAAGSLWGVVPAWLPTAWLPRAWQGDSRCHAKAALRDVQAAQHVRLDPQDADVAAEAQQVQRLCETWLASGGSASTHADMDGVLFFGLSKTYWRGLGPTIRALIPRWWRRHEMAARGDTERGSHDITALQPTWLHLEPGQCFCMLGPNGAGKTTTINCLQGMVRASAGDVLVWGNSVRSAQGLAAARNITGVCPQFDILWPQLTALEHLLLFCAIKGLTRRLSGDSGSATDEAMQILNQVGLQALARTRAGTFSGGQRRRLSLAVALLGGPRLLLLDEPSTGLDPVSRQHVWSLLSDAKRGGRCLLLTTHAMEEADALGDRIGIFVGGALRCVGSGLHLKSRFGDGLRVAVSVSTAQHPAGSLKERCAAIRKLVAQTSAQGTEQEAMPDTAEALNGAGAMPVGIVATAVLDDGVAGESPANAPSGMPATHYERFLVEQARSSALPAVFAALQAAESSLGVMDVQVGLMTLEEVFMSITRHAGME